MAPQSSDQLKILLIEDDHDMALLYYYRFRKEPTMKLLIASTGQAGLELAHQEKPALTLLDLILPDIPGWKILKKLKQDPDTAMTPIIILSNLYKTEWVEKGRRLGAEEYWSKTEMMPAAVTMALKKRLQLL